MGSDKLNAVSVRFSFLNKVHSCGKDIAAGKFRQVGVSLCDLRGVATGAGGKFSSDRVCF